MRMRVYDLVDSGAPASGLEVATARQPRPADSWTTEKLSEHEPVEGLRLRSSIGHGYRGRK